MSAQTLTILADRLQGAVVHAAGADSIAIPVNEVVQLAAVLRSSAELLNLKDAEFSKLCAEHANTIVLAENRRLEQEASVA